MLIRKKLVNQLDELRLFLVQPLFCNENLEAGEVGRTGRRPRQTNHAELYVLKSRMLSVAAGLRYGRGGYFFLGWLARRFSALSNWSAAPAGRARRDMTWSNARHTTS